MAITIDGVKINNFSVTKDEDGKLKVQGQYHLVSSAGVVLAKQGFNGYNDVTLNQSPESAKLLNDLVVSMNKDLNMTLGMG